MTDIVRFEGPPPSARPGPKVGSKIADQLRDHAGDWGIVKVFKSSASARSSAWRIRKGTEMAFQPPGSFEAVTRSVDGEYRVYARYIGEDGEHA